MILRQVPEHLWHYIALLGFGLIPFFWDYAFWFIVCSCFFGIFQNFHQISRTNLIFELKKDIFVIAFLTYFFVNTLVFLLQANSFEINREVVRTVFRSAKPGAQQNVATQGTFDMDVDSNGRWSVEKFKGLLFQIEREMNAIAKETRRGKGNMLVCSSDVASALSMAGVLDYNPALNTGLNVDDTGSTFVGTLNGRIRVYIDPYSALPSEGNNAAQFFIAGYKGTSPYDAGLFYCPYVPLQMVRAIGPDTFQPKIGFKTRYGMVLNPFAKGATALTDSDPVAAGNVNTNVYYRRVRVTNLM